MENKNPVDYIAPNSIAAIWSMMLPGLGQLLKGRVMPGIFWALLVGCGYFLYLWPGLTLHALCIVDAAFNKGEGKFLHLLGIVSCLLIYIVIRNDF